MNKQYLRYASLVLLILGLIGVISGTGLAWAKYTTLGLGVVLYLLSFLTIKTFD